MHHTYNCLGKVLCHLPLISNFRVSFTVVSFNVKFVSFTVGLCHLRLILCHLPLIVSFTVDCVIYGRNNSDHVS